MPRRRPLLRVLTILLLWTGRSVTLAEIWPNWRGPHEDGVSEEVGLTNVWSSEKNVR